MRVFVTQAIDPAGVELLEQAGLEPDIHTGEGPVDRAELLSRLQGATALVSMPTDRIDAEVLDTPGLRIVAQHAVGVDNIDLEAARARGVLVTHTPGVLTDATADLAMALMLTLVRRIPEAHRYMLEGRFRGWSPTLLRGLELRGARLGIVGYGRIGQAVGRRAEAFGMEVVYATSRGGMPLDELFATSDVVSLHCPLTPATHHLVDAVRLARMKPTAYLVNTARGPVVDEAALVEALRSGTIAGAALDVFEQEPEVHPGLLDLPNVVLAPHIGSATWTTRHAMAILVARSVVAALRGEEPPNRLV